MDCTLAAHCSALARVLKELTFTNQVPDGAVTVDLTTAGGRMGAAGLDFDASVLLGVGGFVSVAPGASAALLFVASVLLLASSLASSAIAASVSLRFSRISSSASLESLSYDCCRV